MIIDRLDLMCRECLTGKLQIIDADDNGMTVQCLNDRCPRPTPYDIEPDACGKKSIEKYHIPFLLQKEQQQAASRALHHPSL